MAVWVEVVAERGALMAGAGWWAGERRSGRGSVGGGGAGLMEGGVEMLMCQEGMGRDGVCVSACTSQTHTCKRTHTHTHARMHTRTHARTHTHTCTCTHARTQTDTMIMDLKITDAEGSTPLPGLTGTKMSFDPDSDPLSLAPVSGWVA